MKTTLFSLALLTASSLSANTIQFIEYDLPEFVQRWAIVQQEEEKRDVLYGSVTLDGTEFFSVNFDPEATSQLPSVEELQSGFQIPFPDHQIEATVLHTEKNSLTYEWRAREQESEILHGWGRIISNDKGTVTLNYLTGQINKVDQLRGLWLPVLEGAREVAIEEEAPKVVPSVEK